MHESILSLPIFGRTVYVYGASLALGIAACLLPLLLSLRRAGEQKRLLSMVLWMLPLGFMGGRLLYCLCLIRGILLEGDIGFVLRFADGGYMLYGVMGGAALGLWLYAKLTKASFAKLANAVAPAAALLIAIARAAECMTACGIGWAVENEALHFFPVAVVNEWEEWKYAVFAWEAAIALAIFVYLIVRQRKGRPVAMPMLITYATSQLLMESLRKDDVVSFGFVKVSMLISAILLVVLVILWLARGVKGATLGLGLLLLGLGAIITLEFALDKTVVPNEILYAIMLVVVALLCTLMLRLNSHAEESLPSSAAV